jgi:ribose/xylose/arabinose/galactoside ABC-type transport system permease subunit
MNVRSAALTLVAFFVAILAFFSVFAPRFATSGNVENLMSGFSFVAILAMGQAFPILSHFADDGTRLFLFRCVGAVCTL